MPHLIDAVKAVVLDWDETITESDTMSILAQVTPDPSRWPDFVDAYMTDMQQHETQYGERRTLLDQFAFLGSLNEVEMRSNQRIEEAGVFKGVQMSDLKRVAERVTIRPGFSSFNDRLDSSVIRSILSVNWSKEFIRFGLSEVIKSAEEWNVVANTLDLNPEGYGTGTVSKHREGGIRTALDKLKYLKPKIAEIHELGGLLVYIGDSNTDLPCLLEADLGIVFGKNESLQDTCDKYDIDVLDFSTLDTKKTYERKENRLFRAMTWGEICF